MKLNYKINQVKFYKKPLFITVLNLKSLNLIALFNYITSQKKEENSIGQWRIKYKTI